MILTSVDKDTWIKSSHYCGYMYQFALRLAELEAYLELIKSSNLPF